MGLKFKAGDHVVQVTNPIRGVISELALTDDNSKVQFVVDWTDENGDVHRRPFEEDQIEIDEKAQAEAAQAAEAQTDAPAA